MIRRTILNLSVVTFTAVAFVAEGQAEDPWPEGDVRFYQIASSSLDPYTSDPNAAEQAWMREHYYRMQVWSPYFDQRLSWYPNAWIYKDSYAIKPGWQVFDDHPEWVLRDANGNMLYIPFACSGGTCPQYAGDFGNPAFRAWWIAEARDIIDRGYIGMWVDDVNLTWRVSDGHGNHVTPIDPRTNQPMLLDDWQRYFAEYMEEIRAAFPDITIAHNAIWFVDSPGFDNPYVNRQIDAADFYNLERGAADNGLVYGNGRFGFERFLAFVDRIHARGRSVILMDESVTPQQRDLALASWFLVSNGIDMVSSENKDWTAPDRWWSAYDLRLGAAAGPRYDWHGLLRRDFDCGFVLVNQPGAATTTVDLGESVTDLDGQPVSNLTLSAKSGAMLNIPCSSDPPPAPPSNLIVE